MATVHSLSLPDVNSLSFGSSFQAFLELDSTLIHFDPVRKWLINHEEYAKYFNTDEFANQKPMEVNRILCRAIYLLVEFVKSEQNENEESKSTRTGFPFRLFIDFKPDGALCYILAEMFAFKFEKGWTLFDLGAVSKRPDTLLLLTRIEKCLIDQSLFIIPRVFFAPDVTHALKERLLKSVKEHNGVIVESEALASHIVHEQQALIHESKEILEAKGRIIFSSKEVNLIHQIFKPESYMFWVPNDNKSETQEHVNLNSINCVAKYHVDYNWLISSDYSNEWVSEFDYITKEDNTKEYIDFSSKVFDLTRETTRSPVTADVEPSESNSQPTGETERKDNSEREIVVEIPEPSNNVQIVTSPSAMQPMVQANVELIDMDSGPTDPKRAKLCLSTTEPTSKIADQTFHIIIPSYSAWFDYKSIHEIEKRAIPEFFIDEESEVKSPEMYLYMRNFMIDSYRINPFVYLTLTSVRRNLTGDVCTVFRVHAFLQQWGLINYQCDLEPKLSQDNARRLANPATYHVFGNIKQQVDEAGNDQSSPSTVPEVKANIKPIQIVRSLNATERIAKFDGSGTAKSEETSEEAKTLHNFGLHADLHSSKKKSQNMKSGAASSSSNAVPGSDWTQTEVFLLLEGIQIYEEDWEKISEHVGTKTSEQCITQFLKLPIEDSFITGSKTSEYLSKFDQVPFASNPNPVMTTIAFLAREVDPRLAAEAAKGALDKLSRLATKKAIESALRNEESELHNEEVAAVVTPSHSGAQSSSVYSENDDAISSSAVSGQDFSDDVSCNKENIDITASTLNNGEISSVEGAPPEVSQTSVLNDSEHVVSNEEYNLNCEEHAAMTNFAPTMQSLRDAIDEYERLVINNDEVNNETTEDGSQGANASEMMSFELMEAIHNQPIDRQMSLLATEAALKTSARKANQLRSLVERRIRVAVVSLVETQVKKLELKMKHFEELEAILEKERSEYEMKRKAVLEERLKYVSEQNEIMAELQQKAVQEQQQMALDDQVMQYYQNGQDSNVNT